MNRTYGMYDKETQKEYEAVGNTDGTRKRISGFNICYDRRWRADCPSTKTIPRKVEERNASLTRLQFYPGNSCNGEQCNSFATCLPSSSSL